MELRGDALALLGAFRRLPAPRQAFLVGFAQGMARQVPTWLDTPADRPQRRDLQLGDRVLVFPAIQGTPVRQFGTVVYIHPRKRYYTVALDRGCAQAFRWGAAE